MLLKKWDVLPEELRCEEEILAAFAPDQRHG